MFYQVGTPFHISCMSQNCVNFNFCENCFFCLYKLAVYIESTTSHWPSVTIYHPLKHDFAISFVHARFYGFDVKLEELPLCTDSTPSYGRPRTRKAEFRSKKYWKCLVLIIFELLMQIIAKFKQLLVNSISLLKHTKDAIFKWLHCTWSVYGTTSKLEYLFTIFGNINQL